MKSRLINFEEYNITILEILNDYEVYEYYITHIKTHDFKYAFGVEVRFSKKELRKWLLDHVNWSLML